LNRNNGFDCISRSTHKRVECGKHEFTYDRDGFGRKPEGSRL
jgi:hypothetical protein